MLMEFLDTINELHGKENFYDSFWRHNQANRQVSELDVIQNADEVLIKASIPGVNPAGIGVTVENGTLTIETEFGDAGCDANNNENYLIKERRDSKFYRRLQIPETADIQRVESSYDRGVLTIRFPKLETKRARKIEVKSD